MWRQAGFGVMTAAVVFGVACKQEAPKEQPRQVVDERAEAAVAVPVDRARLAAFSVLPAEMTSDANPLTEEKIALGRTLYFDPRLSKNHDISCNSCHGLDTFGVDNKQFSEGHQGQLGGRNSPTVYNAALHIAQFWDGREPTVEAQAKGPILNPVEMANTEEKVIATLKSIPEYVEMFRKAFPEAKDPVTYDNVANAIGAFERRLVTPSRWDDFLNGDEDALTAAEKKGLDDFMAVGCTTCHSGSNLGGSMYQKVGLLKPWPNQDDLGRFDVTRQEQDKFFFKVPSLRNVAKTAPYFHDGSVESLEEAVKMMASHQLGRELTADQTKSIVAFLGALTGELPSDYIQPPKLPESTDKTPKPDPS